MYIIQRLGKALKKVLSISTLKINLLWFLIEKVEKKRRECFARIEKSSTFASAFRKEQHLKKSSLKDLDINKQVVQVLLKVRNRNRQ